MRDWNYAFLRARRLRTGARQVVGSRLVFALVVATMLLPWHITMIPRFVLISELGLYNSLWAIILPTFLGEAFFIFLLRQFFMTIPEELLEAGKMDGLSHWGLFWQIMVPLSKPAIGDGRTVSVCADVERFRRSAAVLERSAEISVGLRVGTICQFLRRSDPSAAGRRRAFYAANGYPVLSCTENVYPGHFDYGN